MRDAADVPELQEDHAAFGMDGIDDFPPSIDLPFGIDAGHAGAADPVSMTGEASAMMRPPGVARCA